MPFPTPQIGYYTAECCILDCYQIIDEEDLAYANKRIEDNDEAGSLMVFKTLKDAVDYLWVGTCGNDDGSALRHLKALGWEDRDYLDKLVLDFKSSQKFHVPFN